MICDQYQAVFVHNPKAAGTSLKNALWGLPDSKWDGYGWHYSIDELIEKFPHAASYYSFGCVRNPYDRFVSAFTYNIEKVLDTSDYHWDAYPLAYQVLKTYTDQYLTSEDGSWGGTDLIKTFRAFVLSEDFPNIHKKGWPVHFKAQTSFFTQCDLHCVVKFENLMAENSNVRFVETHLGQELNIPYVNMSAHPDYREFYDIACMDRVAKKYIRDFTEFGYNIHMLGEANA